jgi:hypothetical protein
MNVPFRSIVVGAACAIALVVLAFALAPFFDAVGVYIAPLLCSLLLSTKLFQKHWLAS